MISTNLSKGDDRAHIQIGFFQYQGSCTYFATEVMPDNNGNDWDRRIDLADGCRTGTDAHPKVSYNPDTGYEDMSVAGSTLRSSGFDIYTEWTTQPYTAEVSAEGIYYQDEIPGTASNVTNVYDINLQRFDDSWTTDSNGLPNYGEICPAPHIYAKSSIDSSTHSFFFFTDTSRSGHDC